MHESGVEKRVVGSYGRGERELSQGGAVSSDEAKSDWAEHYAV